jgi:hypothetical protein
MDATKWSQLPIILSEYDLSTSIQIPRYVALLVIVATALRRLSVIPYYEIGVVEKDGVNDHIVESRPVSDISQGRDQLGCWQ